MVISECTDSTSTDKGDPIHVDWIDKSRFDIQTALQLGDPDVGWQNVRLR